MRKITPRREALSDQIVAILRDADGFPLSTHQVCETLGGRLVYFNFAGGPPPERRRPACWTADIEDDHNAHNAFCGQCKTFHHLPVWRSYQGEDVRPLLNRLAKAGEIEKIELDTQRQHYWRREDTDR